MDSKRVQREMKDGSETSIKSRINDKDVEFKQWVTFHIDGELFAVDALQVVEVQRYGEITPVPGSNVSISGLINLRGKVITVIDTRVMFVLPHKVPDDKTNIILVDFNQDEMVGFIVDSVDEVINIPTKSIEISPRVSSGDTKSVFVKGVAFYNKKMIIFLDIEKITLHLTPVESGSEY
ncbi:MAG: chemotaxis protein CheW [Oceanospirillaceae bacterium]